MPKPLDVLTMLQSTLRVKNLNSKKLDESNSGLQSSQGFAAQYLGASTSTASGRDKPPETDYKTSIDIGLPIGNIGDGITQVKDEEDEEENKLYDKVFTREQGMPGLPPPKAPVEPPTGGGGMPGMPGLPPMLQGRMPGLPGMAPPAQPAPEPEPQQAPPPEQVAPAAPPEGQQAGPPVEGGAPPPPPEQVAPAPPPGGDPNAMGGAAPPGGDPNAMGGAAPGAAPPGGDPNAMGGDPGMMAAGAPGAPVDMDPMTGLPVRQPSEIGKIYEMKKIYSRLTTIETFLSDTTDQELIEMRNVVGQAIEFFEIVTSNLQSYKDRIDGIIVIFYDFLDQTYSLLAEYFKEKKESFDDKRNKK